MVILKFDIRDPVSENRHIDQMTIYIDSMGGDRFRLENWKTGFRRYINDIVRLTFSDATILISKFTLMDRYGNEYDTDINVSNIQSNTLDKAIVEIETLGLLK